MADNDYPLTTLTRVKTELGISGDGENTLLQWLIDKASAYTEEWCARELKQRTHTREILDGTGVYHLQLPQWPVTEVSFFSTERENAIRVKTDNTCARAFVTVISTGVKLVVQGGSNPGVDDILFTNQATIQAVINAINAVGKGWSADLLHSQRDIWPSSDLIPTPYLSAKSSEGSAVLQIFGPSRNDYEVNEKAGIIYTTSGIPSGIRNVCISYKCGYATIPPVVEGVCVALVSWKYHALDRDPTLTSEQIKQYSYQVGDMEKALPSSLLAEIIHYRRICF